jgi:hypothetical protein
MAIVNPTDADAPAIGVAGVWRSWGEERTVRAPFTVPAHSELILTEEALSIQQSACSSGTPQPRAVWLKADRQQLLAFPANTVPSSPMGIPYER